MAENLILQQIMENFMTVEEKFRKISNVTQLLQQQMIRNSEKRKKKLWTEIDREFLEDRLMQNVVKSNIFEKIPNLKEEFILHN